MEKPISETSASMIEDMKPETQTACMSLLVCCQSELAMELETILRLKESCIENS